jgi:hypothetical protein
LYFVDRAMALPGLRPGSAAMDVVISALGPPD